MHIQDLPTAVYESLLNLGTSVVIFRGSTELAGEPKLATVHYTFVLVVSQCSRTVRFAF